MRFLICASILALAAACAKPGDRMVSADGTVAVGRLVAVSGGEADFGSFTLPVPQAPARVTLRSGASYYGDVSMADRMLQIAFDGGTAGARMKDVSSIVWGDTAVESILFDVPACAGWVNTHLVMVRGTPISIASGGRAVFGTGSSGPEGLERTATTVSTVPEARDGSLVARIGEEGGQFTVGTAWSGTAAADGELWLVVNTPAERPSSGTYTVTISAGEAPGRGVTAIYPSRR